MLGFFEFLIPKFLMKYYIKLNLLHHSIANTLMRKIIFKMCYDHYNQSIFF